MKLMLRVIDGGLLVALALTTGPALASPADAGAAAARPAIAWTVGEVRCGGRLEPAVAPPEPDPMLAAGGAAGLRRVTLGFRIDADGRPLSIARADPATWATADLAPALAAARFAPGAERLDCTIGFTPTAVDVDRPATAIIVRTPTLIAVRPPASYDQTPPCPWPTELPVMTIVRATPPPLPGRLQWMVFGFDIDAGGKAVGMRPLGGNAVAALTEAARIYTAEAVHPAGARANCYSQVGVGPERLRAPPLPDRASMAPPAGASCPAGVAWLRRPEAGYPPPYDARSIDGWAVVAFDVAPSGEVGAARVLRSEPTADFGEAAVASLRTARAQPTPGGQAGCVELWRFDYPHRDGMRISLGWPAGEAEGRR